MKYISIFLFILFSGCAYNGVLTLYPKNLTGEWSKGIPLESKALNGINVGVGYVRKNRNGHEFRARIANSNSFNVDIDPINIQCLEINPTTSAVVNSVNAVDPEIDLARLKARINKDNKGSISEDLDVAVSFIEAFSFPKTEEEKEERKSRYEERERKNSEKKNREESYKTLTELLLRRHTLVQSDATEGNFTCKLYISSGNEMVVSFKVGDNDYRYRYFSKYTK